MQILRQLLITFVKTSLLPSKNDEFHENAHFFYKKLPLFIKNCPLLFIKNSMLQIVIYKKLNFCEEYTPLDFEHKVWSRFWSWRSGKILKLEFVHHFAADALWRLWSLILVEILDKILNFKSSRDADVWLEFWSWCLVEILKMKFDQDLCLNLWYELNPRVRCAFGNV